MLLAKTKVQTMTPSKEVWDLPRLEAHLRANLIGKESYGATIVCAALFYKLYGFFPKVGLSGYQGEAASFLVDVLPEPELKQMEFDLEGAPV